MRSSLQQRESLSAETCQKWKLAFSLVELLMVIAVILVLMSLILAGTLAARRKIQKAHCAHNLDQLGLAVQVFISDNRVYPLAVNPRYFKGGNTEQQTAWMTALEGVLKRGDPVHPASTNSLNSGVWLCPSAQRPKNFPDYMAYFSYGYNDNGLCTRGASLGLGGQNVWLGGPDGTSPPVRDSSVSNPSQLLLIGDGFKGGKGVIVDGVDVLRRDDAVQDNLGSTVRALARHQKRANVVFCDGHVEAPTLKDLFEDSSDAALSRWNRDGQPHRELLSP